MKISIDKIKEFSDSISDSLLKEKKIDFIVGASRGGVVPSALIATRLVKPLVFIYIDKYDNIYFDRKEWIFGKNVLIVDDVVRTGKTISKMKDKIEHEGACNVYFYTVGFCGEKNNDFLKFNKDNYFYSLESEEDIIFPWDYDRETN